MNSLIVIDNFLQDPNSIRKKALSHIFTANQENDSTFPGKRTEVLATIDPEYNAQMFKKLTTVLFNLDQSSYSADIKSYFQLISADFCRGWVHKDNPDKEDIAGVLYLNPNAPINSGTEFYKVKNGVEIKDYTHVKKPFVMGKIKKEDAVDSLRENNNQYELTDFISNKYNRLILYPSHWLHCAGEYFGETNETSRLTQVFFIKCVGHNADVKYFMDKVRYA
jgi:hypothetical protein